MRNPEWIIPEEEFEPLPQSTLRLVDAPWEEELFAVDVDEMAKNAPRAPLSWSARLAQAAAPLFSLFYDLQMAWGKGVRAERQRIVLNNFPANTPPLRAAFVSDLHYGPTSGRVAARQAWSILRDTEVDVLFLGGDYFYAGERGLPTLVREIQRWRRVHPKATVYAVLGNHDYKVNTEALVMCLEACGVQVLLNEAVTLPAPWENIWLAGIDDMLFGKPDMEATLSPIPRGACTIMLSHSPDVCEDKALKRCDLTLCGHTHGGQVCWPSSEPVFLSSTWGKHYTNGLHRHAGNWVWVSRGVGTVAFPLRMWAPPDVGLLEISGRGGIGR
jgi:predicted MPP superfamily phosphohydrolase